MYDPANEPDPKQIWVNVCHNCNLIEEMCDCDNPDLGEVEGVICPSCHQEMTNQDWSGHDLADCGWLLEDS